MIDKLKELVANVTESGEIFLSDFEVLNEFTGELSEEAKYKVREAFDNPDDLVFREFKDFNNRFESIFS